MEQPSLTDLKILLDWSEEQLRITLNVPALHSRAQVTNEIVKRAFEATCKEKIYQLRALELGQKY